MRSNQSQPQPVVGMARRAIRGGVPDTLRSRWHCVQPTRQASLGGRPCFSSSRESRTRPARCPWSLSPCIAQMHGLESRGVLRREDSQQAEAGFTLFLPWRRLKVLAVHELVWTCKGRRSHSECVCGGGGGEDGVRSPPLSLSLSPRVAMRGPCLFSKLQHNGVFSVQPPGRAPPEAEVIVAPRSPLCGVV